MTFLGLLRCYRESLWLTVGNWAGAALIYIAPEAHTELFSAVGLTASIAAAWYLNAAIDKGDKRIEAYINGQS